MVTNPADILVGMNYKDLMPTRISAGLVTILVSLLFYNHDPYRL